MGKLLKILGLVGLLTLPAATASASTISLTINDTYTNGLNTPSTTVWTLTVETNCTTCDVKLSAFFQDLDGAGSKVNAYTGTYIDGVDFKIDGADPTAIVVDAGTVGGASAWTPSIDAKVNASGCNTNGNPADNLCASWANIASTPGYGPVVNGSTYLWDFTVTFASQIGTATTGNIRATFNTNSTTGNGWQNFNIFSPSGGNATFTPPTGGNPVPEPTTFALLGTGLLVAAGRALRKNKQKA